MAGVIRRVLTRKRSALTDSLIVVRTTGRALIQQRFLVRVMVGVLVLLVSSLVIWRLAAPPPGSKARSAARPVMVSLRVVLTLCVQHIVASWLFARWSGERGERVLRLWRRLVKRLPAFAACAALLGWLDHASGSGGAATIVRSGAAFAMSYLLSYAVPAAAAFHCGMWAATVRSVRAFRRTFGADMFAWSGMWVVNGVVALLTAVPEALDLYSPATGGLAGRLSGWLLVLPLTMTATAIGAGFCTVIYYALETGRAPEGYPVTPVETISGLQLAR